MIRLMGVFAAGLLAMATAGAVSADDTVRLGGTGEADVHEAAYRGGGYRGGGGYYGGYRGGYGYAGYRGGYGYGGYRGGYGYGGYRGGYGYGWGGYRPYYSNYGYRPYFGVSFYSTPSYYYQTPYYSSYYVSPCATDLTEVPTTSLTLARSSVPMASGDGTFPYNGDPRGFMPTPVSPNAPAGLPVRPTLPRDGRLVSLPTSSTSPYQYLAFGETAPAASQPRLATSPSDTLRVSFPAFGEETQTIGGGTMTFTQLRK